MQNSPAKTVIATLLIAAPIALFSSLPSKAETPLSGAEFEAYATGKTLTFSQGGQAYGAEEYRSGRRVRWAFSADQCMEGIWYEQGDEICFAYEDEKGPQCWRFFRQGDGLRAQFSGEAETVLYEATQSNKPLLCLGPEVGA